MYKKLKNYLLTGASTLFLWILLLIIAYALPMHSIKQHIRESLPTFEKEGLYPQENINDMSTQRDNFTDAYMMNIAGYAGEKTLLERAFGSYYTTSDDTANPIEWLKYENGKPESYTLQYIKNGIWDVESPRLLHMPILFFISFFFAISRSPGLSDPNPDCMVF